MTIFSIKRDHENIFRFLSILFLCDFNVIIFLVWMRVIGMFGGISKIFSICKYPFYHSDVWGISKTFSISKYSFYELKSRKQ